MSTLKVAAINNPSAASGGISISTAGNPTGTGLDLITTQNFSSAAAVNLNNCFSTTYDVYRIECRWQQNTSLGNFTIRMRTGGVDQSGANYDSYGRYDGAVTPANVSTTGATSWLSMAPGAGGVGQFSMTLFRPYEAVATTMEFVCWDSRGFRLGMAGPHNVASAMDGISLLTSAGSMTGFVRVYGYRN